MVNWRQVQGKYGAMFFTNAEDFLHAPESEIPVEIRRTYDNYTKTKDPALLSKKGDRYTPEWNVDDTSAGWRYKATYDDRYGWGVMRTKIKVKPDDGGGGQEQLPSTNLEAAVNLMNTRLSEIHKTLGDIKESNEVIAGYFAQKGIKTADKVKEDEQSKADKAAADAEEEDFGNEDF